VKLRRALALALAGAWLAAAGALAGGPKPAPAPDASAGSGGAAATPGPAAAAPGTAKPSPAPEDQPTAAERELEEQHKGGAAPAPSGPLNGFVISRQLVDRDDIVPGGPPRDGIHAVDRPEYVKPAAATWVDPASQVIGVVVNGDARAYPLLIMDRHQIVDDRVGGVPLAVTWDPLTGAPLAYKRSVDGRVLHLGVSGLLYNSGFLMYDHGTESLWSQFLGKAISGPLAGKTLERVRVRLEDLGTWMGREPGTTVLARPYLHEIDYRYSPFERYVQLDRPSYPVKARDTRFHAKELVLGIVVSGHARAYLASIVAREGGYAEDDFYGRKIQITFSPALDVFHWEAPADVPVTEAYWFAWKAFHPDTDVWKDPGPVERAPEPAGQ
jgi:hypothetical protein